MATFDELITRLRNEHKQKRITFDDSYISSVRKYYDWFLDSRQFAHWSKEYRIRAVTSAISKATEIAVELAHDKGIDVVNASLFKEAVGVFERKYKAYKGPYREPDDRGDSRRRKNNLP